MPLVLPTAPFVPSQLVAGGKVVATFTPSVPTQQVTTLALTGGSVTTAGTLVLTLTGTLVAGSPLAINVAVLIGDTLAMVAAKMRIALQALSAVTNFYTVAAINSGQNVVLTAITGAANEAGFSLNLSSLGAAVGPTLVNSTITTAGSTGGTAINIAAKIADYVYKTDVVERQIAGADGVMRPDRQMVKGAREEFVLTDIEEIDFLLTNFPGFTGINKNGTCQLWISDQTDQAGVSVRLKSVAFACSLTIKSGSTKFGGGDFSKYSITILSLSGAPVTFTINSTS